MLLYVVAAASFLCIAVLVIAAATRLSDRAAVRSALQTAVDVAPVTTAPVLPEDRASFAERVVVPALRAAGRLTALLTPPGYLASVSRRLTLAGRPGEDELDSFMAGRVVTIVLVPVMLVISAFLPVSHLDAIAFFLFFALMLILGPESALNRRVEKRQNEIRRQLPDVLDLLTISVEAGLGFDQALARTVVAVQGPLSDELTRMLGETRAGAGRREALEAMDERTDVPEFRSFILALIQADTFGISIAQILRAQSEEARTSRRQFAEEKAQKAPVKMMFPLVFCILPSIFVVIIGPAAIEVYRQLFPVLGIH